MMALPVTFDSVNEFNLKTFDGILSDYAKKLLHGYNEHFWPVCYNRVRLYLPATTFLLSKSVVTSYL